MQIFRKEAFKILQLVEQFVNFIAVAGFTVSENKDRGFSQCSFIQLGYSIYKATETLMLRPIVITLLLLSFPVGDAERLFQAG